MKLRHRLALRRIRRGRLSRRMLRRYLRDNR